MRILNVTEIRTNSSNYRVFGNKTELRKRGLICFPLTLVSLATFEARYSFGENKMS